MRQKNIVFTDDDDQHARMILRLRYDRLTQGNFFRGIVEMYVNNDLDMAKIVQKIKQSKSTIGKKLSSNAMKDIEKGEQMKEQLGLSENEKNFIFDLIEEDFEEEN
tara:strand:- start:101 stop:418 length:318 start_codon:yes stop_codon:yes gene_type:complete